MGKVKVTLARQAKETTDSLALLDLKRSLRSKFRQILAENRVMVNVVNSHIRQAEVEIGNLEGLDRVSGAKLTALTSRLDVCHDTCVQLTEMANRLFDRPDISSSRRSQSQSSAESSSCDTSPASQHTERRLEVLEQQFHSLIGTSLSDVTNATMKRKRKPHSKRSLESYITDITTAPLRKQHGRGDVWMKDSSAQWEDVHPRPRSQPSSSGRDFKTPPSGRAVITGSDGATTRSEVRGQKLQPGDVSRCTASHGRRGKSETTSRQSQLDSILKHAIKEFQDRIDHIITSKDINSSILSKSDPDELLGNEETISSDVDINTDVDSTGMLRPQHTGSPVRDDSETCDHARHEISDNVYKNLVLLRAFSKET